jgi:predicted AAA+ superfamily ATPase
MQALDKIENLFLKIHSLVIFHDLLEDPVIKRAVFMLGSVHDDIHNRVKAYSSFASMLFNRTTCWTDYVLRQTLACENSYIARYLRNEAVDPVLEECLRYELSVLEELSQINAKDVKEKIGYQGYLPEWTIAKTDFFTSYKERIDRIEKIGFGIYSLYRMFTVLERTVVPVKRPDPIRLFDLKGYENQRNIVIDNTLALLKGKPASNVLLYGDAGTGKSSTVKAIVNEYYHLGLRLIEIPKKQMEYLNEVIEGLYDNPLKFILFIDDLSFFQENDDFYALKAILEGTAYAKPDNVVIYATGNRRHLIKEKFSDREGDDVHRNETIQELTSLAARFGIKVGFFRPNKETYLRIVRELKDQYKIDIDDEELEIQAERFAANGRSPRVARQFIEYLKSKAE